MKKALDFIKPFISIVFGALIILLYLNGLSNGDKDTIRGVFALIVGSYFIVVGLLGLLAPEQIGGNVLRLLNSIGISVYAVFFFIITLVDVIDFNSAYGVNGWIVAYVSLSVSIAFAVLFIIQLFVKNQIIQRLARLFGMLFLLALLLDLLFDFAGNPETLGNIVLLLLMTYVTFASIYLGTWKE